MEILSLFNENCNHLHLNIHVYRHQCIKPSTILIVITRERVAVEILSVFKEQTSKWGVTVERVEVCIAVDNVEQTNRICYCHDDYYHYHDRINRHKISSFWS